jgi:hypothetical protein
MHSIQSIICFNGGSAGDLIKGLCLGQYQLESTGAVFFKNQYFKDITKKIYYQTASKNDIDIQKICTVDNTHFYMDFYHDLAKQIFYIDYPDHLQSSILTAVNNKRHQGNWQSFLEWALYSIPKPLQAKITADNTIDVFKILWSKNLQGWRKNPRMCPINFVDFFDSDKLKGIIEMVSNTTITNYDFFKHNHQSWLEKNSDLFPI